ncbi:MAG: sulfoxide reductase heme-binding subunit YedZ [Burkholderiaceae bacterium]|nr:sulfoxide reductase heme-binding subunit YedZ [Burkholderiaceae bacterium]
MNGPGARLRAWLSAGVPPVLEPRSPVEFVIRSLGTWALVALVVTLSITPLRLATGWAWPMRLRRMFGLFAFFYAALHLLAYLWLDHWFDTAAIWGDVTKRPYIAAGLVAMALLVPLAVTSSNGWVKRLGGRNWQRLHRLVYVIAALAVVHFWWQKAAKNDVGEPLLYAVVIGLLLGVRALRWARRRYGSVDSSANSSSTDSRRRTS